MESCADATPPAVAKTAATAATASSRREPERRRVAFAAKPGAQPDDWGETEGDRGGGSITFLRLGGFGLRPVRTENYSTLTWLLEAQISLRRQGDSSEGHRSGI